jgi:hypothetical protein
MIKKTLQQIKKHVTNLPGWRTDRKIIVFESDDWGSVRMPSKEVYKKCLKAGYPVDKISYERFDSLESEDDLELLFDLLSSFKDINGKHPKFTANVLVANPDFERIRESGHKKYYYEPVAETFRKYPKHSGCIELWKDGFEKGVFYPQSHGREHLNVLMFMNSLRSNDQDMIFAVQNNMPGFVARVNSSYGNKFVEALRFENESDKYEKLNIALEGLDMFFNIFGYRSRSFIPPNYIWSPDFDSEMQKKGVEFYQGNRKMKEPVGDGKIKLNSHYLGEKNEFGQRYLIRNAHFEPSMFNLGESDWVSKCLNDIHIAFRMNKPAIICTHRLNYIGFIDEQNRDINLSLLKKLIYNITNIWPDVEFLTSDELGDEIECHE